MKIAFSLLVCIFLFSCNSEDEQPTISENWVLQQRKVYRYTLNNVGYPDTTFIKTYRYEDHNIVDSSEEISVAIYKDGQLVNRRKYKLKKDSLPLSDGEIEYTYNNKYPKTITTKSQGRIQKHEKYVYDTANKLIKYTYIQAGLFLGNKYDTVNVVYVYDAANKNMGASLMNNKGELLRKDVNIYSGTTPLASYHLNSNGDTIQKMEYKIDGRYFISKIENDSIINHNWTVKNFPLRQLTIHKKKNEQFKNDIFYKEGRLIEEKTYKLVKDRN